MASVSAVIASWSTSSYGRGTAVVGLGQIAGVKQRRREDLAIRLADDACHRGQIGALRQSSYAVDPPQAQVLPGDADPPGEFGIADAVSVLVAVDQLDEARGCHTAKYSAKI